tara:strand:+ start:2380 stop:5166 length:2787 start_codon:yes stop_codon:yes gene_type:complete
MNNMEANFRKFLEQFKKAKNDKSKVTHIIPDYGSYNIDQTNIDKFYAYCVDEFFVKNKTYMCAEKLADTCPFIIDLDFKYKSSYRSRQYTRETIDDLCQLFLKTLDKIFDLDINKKEIWIFEKDNIRSCDKKEYKSKDGIHLVFPKIISDKKLYSYFIDLIHEEKELFDEIITNTCSHIPDNSMSDIIDKSIYSGNWLIYGSRKKDDTNRYNLTRITKLNHSNTFIDTDIKPFLDMPKSIIINNSVYSAKVNVDYSDSAKEYLNTKNLNNNIIMDLDMEEENINTFVNTIKEKEIELIKTLVDKLDSSRAEPYDSWRDVGLLLHGISKQTYMLDIWKSFSKKSPDYKESACDEKWKVWRTNLRKDNVLTIKTLHWWVKQDIPIQEYRDLIKDSLKIKIDESLKGDKTTGTHYDVANVIADYYKNEFICSGLKENFWYYFNESKGGKWEPTEIGHELRKKLSGEIVNIYLYYASKYQNLSQASEESSMERKIYDLLVANCGKIISKLKDSTYKDKIIRECRELFYDEEFDEKINSNFDLIGFDNGIFDLKAMVFRKGQPDDYVTISTKYSIPINNLSKPVPFTDLYNFMINKTNYNTFNNDLESFIQKVLPNRIDKETKERTDSRTRDYVLRFLSSCLSGHVREEKFYFWTGSGGNGKSKLIELLDLALGDYSKSLDVAYLTTKRGSSSSASPEIETLRYARFVTCSEPEEHDKIYVGKLKQITGGDKLTSRGLFKETTEFKPQFKIVLMCNELPKLQNQDGGTWRRIEVVNFISEFKDNPKPTTDNPNIFKADIELSSKLEEWKLFFMITLLSKYQDYTKHGTNPPDEVISKTSQYKQDSDIITNWFHSSIVECEPIDGLAPTSIDTLYENFKTWCTDEGIDKKDLPTKKKIKDSLIKYQEKSSYKAEWGKEKRNGLKQSPKFTFRTT